MKPHIDTLKRWIHMGVSASVLAAFAATGSAQAAMYRQPPIHWGGGSAASASQANTTHFRQWRPLWRYVWSRTEQIYDMHPAQSVAGQSDCPANLGIGNTIERTIDAVNTRHYGDAVKAFGRFQSRLLCLSMDGAHGVDFALSAFNALAMRDLTGRERAQAVTGSFNLGLLAFDGIQYSGRSWWLPVMAHDETTVASIIRNYPGRQLGLWLYDVQAGQLHQLTFGGPDLSVYRGLMNAFDHPYAFDHGECSLLGMAAAGFSCGGGGNDNRSMGSGTGSGGGGGGFGSGSGGSGGLSCAVSAAMRTGSLGSLSCLARASGLGGMRMPTTAASHVQLHGVLDGQCAADDGNGKPKLKDFDTTKSGSKHKNADSVGRKIVNWILSHLGGGGSSGSKTAKSGGGTHHHVGPPVSQPPPPGSDAETWKQWNDYQQWLKKTKPKPGSHGYVAGGGSAGGGSSGYCGGHGTNAAMQVAAMFSCTGGGSAGDGMRASGPRFPGSGGTNPYAFPGQGGAAGSPSGLLSCAMQGGGLVRTSYHDKRCQQVDCAYGQNCSCNGSGGGSAPSSVTAAGRRRITSPNNMNRGAMDYGRNHVGNIGGFHGPKIPTFGGGPSKQ